MIENIKYVEMEGKTYLMPSHLQVEVVGGKGMCNAHCAMCTIDKWERPPTIMSDEVFKSIMDSVAPFKQHIEYVTMHGNGEPLLDKRMAHKVRYAKQSGFSGVGFASNCSALTRKRADELIAAGLDTIICSIDGMKKETHEAIRPGTDYDAVVRNVKYFIESRNRSGKTKILVRFIRQELNQHEFPEYKAYWEKLLNLAFCDADYNGFYDLGNVQKEHFLKLYNGERLNFYRQKMESGRIRELPYCKSCTIPISRANKTEPTGSADKAPPVTSGVKTIPIRKAQQTLPL